MSSSTVIVIIGAGITGASIAAQLSAFDDPKHDLQIILIDAFDPRKPSQYKTLQNKQIAATIFSGGWINSCWKTPVCYNILNHLSLEMWPGFMRSLDINPSDIEFTKNGTLCFSDSPRSTKLMKQNVNDAIRSGANYRKINRNTIHTLLPSFNDTDSHSSAEFYYNKDEGAVNPLLAIQRIINRVTQRHNVRFMEQKVIGFECHKTHTIDAVVLQNGDTIACDVVVLSAGTSIPKLVQSIDSSVVVPMIESKSLVVRCKTSCAIKTNVSVLKKFSGSNNYTLIPRRSVVHMTGGYGYSQKGMNDPNAFKKDVCSKWMHYLHQYKIQPKDCHVMGPFYRTMPLDRKPIIGFLGRDCNAYVATMHSGVTLAPLMSSLISNEIMLWLNQQQIDSGVLDSFRLSRFSNKRSKL